MKIVRTCDHYSDQRGMTETLRFVVLDGNCYLRSGRNGCVSHTTSFSNPTSILFVLGSSQNVPTPSRVSILKFVNIDLQSFFTSLSFLRNYIKEDIRVKEVINFQLDDQHQFCHVQECIFLSEDYCMYLYRYCEYGNWILAVLLVVVDVVISMLIFQADKVSGLTSVIYFIRKLGIVNL